MNSTGKVITLSLIMVLSTSISAKELYFSCMTPKGEVSLKVEGVDLTYEMKNINGENFKYSSSPPNYNGFFYNHYSRFQVDYLNIGFNKSGFRYVVFSHYEDGNDTKGISVVNLKTKKEYIYKCKDKGIDKLDVLAEMLQCNKDDSLGCN